MASYAIPYRLKILFPLVVLAFSGALFAVLPYGELFQKLFMFAFAALGVTIYSRVLFSGTALILLSPFLIILGIAAITRPMIAPLSFLQMVAIFQPYLLCILMFLCAIVWPLSLRDCRFLKQLFLVITILQVLFALVKLSVHGIDEGWLIGTMSHSAGQLSFLFPAIAVPVIVFMMKSRGIFFYVLLIAGMFAFSIINEKRAAVFLLPCVTFLSLWLIGPSLEDRKSAKGRLLPLALSSIVIIVMVLAGLAMIPSLNPHEERFGEISIQHAFSYVVTYLTMDYGGALQGTYADAATNQGIQVGRLTLISSIFDWLFSSDISRTLFGLGIGSVTPSIWVNNSSDLLFEALGTRGAISGFGLTIVETGLAGALTICSFFVLVLVALTKEYRKVRSHCARRWLRTLFVVYLVFCFDYFFYSIVLFRTLPMPFLVFFAVASFFLIRRVDADLLRIESNDMGYDNPSVSANAALP